MASHPPTKGTIEDRKKVIQTLHECCGGYAIVHNEVLGHKPQLAQKSDVSTGADDGSIVDKVADQRLVGELQMLATHVDKEATKLIVVFMQDPVVSSECIPVTDMFMKAIMLFASRWVQITPAAIGSARYHILRRCVIKLMQAGETLVKTLDDAQGMAVKVAHDTNDVTVSSMSGGGAGELSAAAKSFLGLPRTNTEAVCTWMSQAHDMASDALDELEAAAEERRKILAAGGDAKETIEKAAADAKPTAADSELKTDIGDADSSGDDFFAQMLSNMMDMDMSDFTKWDAADMILVPNVIGMIKVATKTMSRTNGLLAKVHESSMEEPLTTELPAVEEMLFDTCGEVTKHVDELVDAAYVPMNKERLPVESHIICEHVQKILAAARQLGRGSETDAKWIDILERAAVHNSEKLTANCAP